MSIQKGPVPPNKSRSSEPLNVGEKQFRGEIQSPSVNTVFQAAGLPPISFEEGSDAGKREGSFNPVSPAKRSREEFNPAFGPDQNFHSQHVKENEFDSPSSFENA